MPKNSIHYDAKLKIYETNEMIKGNISHLVLLMSLTVILQTLVFLILSFWFWVVILYNLNNFNFRRNIKRSRKDASQKRTTFTSSQSLAVIRRSKEPDPEPHRVPVPGLKIWKNRIHFSKTSPKVRTEIRTHSPAKTEEICSKMKITMTRAKIHFSSIFSFRTKVNNLGFVFSVTDIFLTAQKFRVSKLKKF